MGDTGWAAGLGLALGALITGVFAWIVQRNRGDAAIQVAVLAEWQKLNAALSKRVSDLEADLADVRRQHSKEVEEMRTKHRTEMQGLRELNEGLQRQLMQNSQSTAQMLSDHPETRPKSDGK